MLPGINFIMGTAAALALSFSFVAGNASATSSTTIPATAQAGDFCMVVNLVRDSSGTVNAAVTPSGFTKQVDLTDSSNGDGYRFVVCTKVLVSGDVGATVNGATGTRTCVWAMVWRPSTSISTISVAYSARAATTGDPAAQSYTPVAGDLPVISFVGAIGNGNTPLTLGPSGQVTSLDASSDNTGGHYTTNTSLSTISGDVGDSGNWTFLATVVIKVT